MRAAITMACLLLGLSGSAALANSAWTVIRQQGREYVTFSNVAHFYNFPEYTRVSHSVSLAERAAAGFGPRPAPPSSISMESGL